jgi:hypothetical protein
MQWGRLSAEFFKTMNFKQYTFKEYNGMVHSTCDEVITIEFLFLIILFFYSGNPRCDCFYQKKFTEGLGLFIVFL